MAIFRGTTGTGSSDNTIVSAVTEQAGIATTKADEAEGFRDEAEGFKNTASTAATTATTKATEANASATTAEDNKDLCVALRGETLGLAQDALASANAAEASATTANSSAVQTVAGSNTQVVGVYNNIANVNTVAGVNTDVTTVAGISSDVTTVAADASDIGTVSTNIANVNNVGNNIANVNAVHSNASNINTVAADGTDIGTVATNIANVNTVAGISSTVTTVAGLESKMDTVIADASDIGAVAGNIGDVTTVAGINSDVDTVAGIAAKVTTVADNISDVQNADTNATNAASSASDASASATSASNSATTATTKATEASNSATAASNSATTATTKASQAAGSATTAGTSASTATTKASEASASATTATTKAGEAASSASAASGSATTAVTKASEASASAASASTSATNSSNAASTWNDFYTTYLGAADAPPTADVQGNALQTGAFYYDTGAGSNTVGLYVYNGSSWVYSTNYNNVTAPYSLSQDLATNSNDINFGNNAKAQFGAGNDLQIYSDGTHSRIHESGSGLLVVRASNFNVNTADGSESYITMEDGGGVASFYNGSQKLKTTSTGIDVTGDINGTGDVIIESPNPYLDLKDTTNPSTFRIYNADSTVRYYADKNDEKSNSKHEFRVDGDKQVAVFRGGGDVYFYEDTGTTPKFFWDASAERLGIGTSSPSYPLTVYGSNPDSEIVASFGSANSTNEYTAIGLSGFIAGNDATKAGIALKRVGTFGTGELHFLNNNTLNDSDMTLSDSKMMIDSSGNVGIGTTNPDAKIEIVGNGTTVKVSNSAVSSTNTAIQLGGYAASNNSAYGAHIRAYHNFGVGGASSLVFETSGTQERMRISDDGNVGIGTTSPSEALEVNGKVKADTHFTSSDGNVTLSTSGNGGTVYLRPNGVTTTTGQVIVNTSGNLGIGTASPARPLTVNGLAGFRNSTTGFATSDGFDIGVGDSDAYIVQRENANIIIETNGAERMRIDSSGNLSVGTTANPSGTVEGIRAASNGVLYAASAGTAPLVLYRHDSDGNILNFHKDGTSVGSISVTSSATAYNTSSDERLKENIQDAEDAGSKIDAIQVRQFDWKSDGSHQDYGVVAQELVTVAPEAVHQPENEDDMMSVDYSKLVPTLIKEIQTLRNRVAQLENN